MLSCTSMLARYAQTFSGTFRRNIIAYDHETHTVSSNQSDIRTFHVIRVNVYVCVRVRMCMRPLRVRAKNNSTRMYVPHCCQSMVCDFVTRAAAPQNRAFTIRNTRNYATSEKVKSRGKFAVGRGR